MRIRAYMEGNRKKHVKKWLPSGLQQKSATTALQKYAGGPVCKVVVADFCRKYDGKNFFENV